MTDDRQHDEFVRRAREVLRSGDDALDARVLSRLNRARHAALEAHAAAPFWRRWLRWPGPGALLPAGGVAAAVLVALLVVPLMQSQQPVLPGGGEADDMDLLLSSEQFEMLEDIEFYAWIEEQSDVG